MGDSIYAQRRVLSTSALITFTVGTLAGFNRGEGVPTARFIVGIGLAYTICSVMVDLGSPLGAGFAVLIMLSAMLYNGEDALDLLGERSKKPRKSKKVRKQRFQRKGALAVQSLADNFDTQFPSPDWR